MNLSPGWAPFLLSNGIDAVHWSTEGKADASDAEILSWARENGRTVFTHDLDFGIALALSKENGPSVVQVRSQDITPLHLGRLVVEVLHTHADVIGRGALLTIDEARARVRILPIF